jgi:hypothetical protein
MKRQGRKPVVRAWGGSIHRWRNGGRPAITALASIHRVNSGSFGRVDAKGAL